MGVTKRHQARFGLTSAEVGRLFEAQGNRCQNCGRSDVTLGIDHIRPVSKGGDHDPDNFQILCRACNSRKGNRVVVDYRSAPVTITRDARKAKSDGIVFPNGDRGYSLRLPTDLYAAIKQAAAKEDRSINYIIVRSLKAEFGEDDATPKRGDTTPDAADK